MQYIVEIFEIFSGAAHFTLTLLRAQYMSRKIKSIIDWLLVPYVYQTCVMPL